MLSPSTRGMLLQTKSAGLESFVVSLQARNQFSKPSTEMELIQWPRAARSTTCEQDRCVCVILHISPWRYGRIVTLSWCINDDCNLCVCDFASQETCFCDYPCGVQFFVWLTYSQSLWLPQQFDKSTCFSQDSWCKLDLDLASEIMLDCWRWTLFYLAYLFRSWQRTRFAK
jgi:hypothetical protein